MAFIFGELTPDQIQRGMACKSLGEFKAFVKGEGFDLDENEARALFEEMYEMELSDEEFEGVAGGVSWRDCDDEMEPCDDYGCPEYIRTHLTRRR